VRFVLFVEGWTEDEVLPGFLKRWLDARVSQTIGIHSVRFNGNTHYLTEVAKKVRLHLQDASVLAVVGLLDLYRLDPEISGANLPAVSTPSTRVTSARAAIMKLIDPRCQSRFRQYFAVHELEAWLLSDERLFPGVRLPSVCSRPEDVDFDDPPSQMIDRLVRATKNGRYGYKKRVTARSLFQRLDPDVVYEKCPNFHRMMDDMLELTRGAL